LLSDGNVLVEKSSVSGLGPAVSSLARNVDANFHSVRFAAPARSSPDMGSGQRSLPPREALEPLFHTSSTSADIIFVDGLHFAPFWLQMGLLATMAQHEVTSSVAPARHAPEFFLVIATHEESTEEGVLPLPDDRRDQFLLHARESDPAWHVMIAPEPAAANDSDHRPHPRPSWGGSAPISRQTIFDARAEVCGVTLPLAIERYLGSLARAVLYPGICSMDFARWVQPGSGLRAFLALKQASRAHAWLCGSSAVTFDDVVAVAGDCLRHRLLPSAYSRADGKTTHELIALLLEHFSPGVCHEA
jgi:MoxR-like ATPase